MTMTHAIDPDPPTVLVVGDGERVDVLDGTELEATEATATASAAPTFEAALGRADGQVPVCIVVTDAIPLERIRECDVPVVVYADRTDIDEGTIARLADEDGAEYVPAGADTADGDLLVAAVRRRLDGAVIRADRDLRASAMEEAGVGITIADMCHPDEPLIYANGGFAAMTGYGVEEVVGTNCRFLQGEGTDPETVEEIRSALESAEPIEVDVRNYRADGTPFWNHLALSPVRDEDGAVTHYFGYQNDVTERKRTEIERRRIVEIASRTSPSLEGKVREMLALGCDRFGVDVGFLSSIDGDDFEVVVSRGDHERLQAGDRAPLAETYCRKTVERDEPLAVRDAEEQGWDGDPAYETYDLGCYIGTTVVVDGGVYGTLCFADVEPRDREFSSADGTFVEMVAGWIAHEIERRKRERDLERQNERLGEFASFVSHDLRNPLGVARGHVESLRDGPADGTHVEEALRSLDRMESMIEGVLRLARDGDAVDDPEAVDLATVANRARRNVGDGSVAVAADQGTVLADPERLQTVVENLVRNAVEHGGATEVRIGATGDGFYVADDGSGIPDEDRDRIFERGFSTDSEGTGLGLAIVRTIADAHGWDVAATDSEAGGTRIEFTGVQRP